MITTVDHDITWWLSRLQKVQVSSTGWVALCPVHPDVKPSLSLKVADDGETVLVHCFAGCEYSEILERVEDTWSITLSTQTSTAALPALDPSAWWSEYTGVPVERWTEWGVRFDASNVIFTWEDTSAVKVRRAGTKEFFWPNTVASPPIWPSVPETLPSTVFMCEGESDCGVLRLLGLPAWAVTKGAETPGLDRVLSVLRRRGVSQVVSVFDQDTAGSKGGDHLAAACFNQGLEFSSFDLSHLLDPLLGEKDVRDVWLRLHDPVRLRDMFSRSTFETRNTRRRVDVIEFLSRSVAESQWLVDDVLLRETVGMIIGSPKVGKSWMAHDLAISVATGTPFLGRFECKSPGPVVVITKEDPDYLLQDRIEKIMVSKGLGGTFDPASGHLAFPSAEDIPLYFDLTRSFVFTDQEAASLLIWLRQIREKLGGLALVIFDPTLRMLSGVDEFKATEISGSVFRIAQKIQTEMKCGVLLVHHRSKSGTDGKSSYGSIAFHAFSESSLYIQGEPDENGWTNVQTEFKSAREGKWAYRFRDLEHQYTVEVSDDTVARATPGAVDTTSASILRLLSVFPKGLSVGEVVESLPEGVSDFMARKALKVLESQHKISRSKSDSSSPAGGKRGDIWKIQEKI